MRYVSLLSLMLLACGLFAGCSSETADDIAGESTLISADVQQQETQKERAAASSKHDQSSSEVYQEVEESPETVFEGLTARVLARPDHAFANCDELLSFYRAASLTAVDDGTFFWHALTDESYEPTDVFKATAGVTSAGGTNLRVSGVDEADVVKTDGERLYLVTGNDRLISSRIRNTSPPEILAELELPMRNDGARSDSFGASLLISEGRAFLFRSYLGRIRGGENVGSVRHSEVIEVDLTVPEAPRIVRVLELRDTVIAAAYMVNEGVRLVLRHRKYLPLDEIYATIPEEEDLSVWHPDYLLTDTKLGPAAGSVTECDNTHLSSRTPFEIGRGLTVTSVLQFDARKGLERWTSALLLADVWDIYATPSAIYLTSYPKQLQANSIEIHRFDLLEGAKPRYDGSIHLRGSIDDSWGMHEHGGRLHVWWSQESFDTAGRSAGQGHLLTAIHLGKWIATGVPTIESEVSVEGSLMFIGDFAYLLLNPQNHTRETSVRLSDYSAVTRSGEAVLPGYHQYLHQLGGDQFLAIGPPGDGVKTIPVASLLGRDEAGQLQLTDRIELDATGVDPILDHRSFLWKDGIAWSGGRSESEALFFGIKIEEEALSVVATWQLPQGQTRGVIAGGQLHIVSPREISSFSLDDHRRLGVVQIPVP